MYTVAHSFVYTCNSHGFMLLVRRACTFSVMSFPLILFLSYVICSLHDIDIIYAIHTYLGDSTHDVVHWGNAPKRYTTLCSPPMTLIFFSLLLILLCGLAWFYAYKCHICFPISAHGLWEWLMILALFAQRRYDNVLDWLVGIY